MNVLYIFKEYYNRRARYKDEMESLGWNVEKHTVKDKTRKINISQERLAGIDLIFVLQYSLLDGLTASGFIKNAKKKNIPIVAYHSFTKKTSIKQYIDMVNSVDIVFETNEEVAEMACESSGSDKFVFMPLGFYKDQYYPIETEYRYDVTYMGNPEKTFSEKEDRRVKDIKTMLKHFNVTVFGRSICRRCGVAINEFTDHKKQCYTYNRSRVNLVLPYNKSVIPEFMGFMHAVNRFFEIPACESLGLCVYNKSLIKLFEPDKEMLYYSNDDEMIEKTRWVLDNPEEADKIRKAAYKRAIENHQYKHRFEAIKKIVGERLKIW